MITIIGWIGNRPTSLNGDQIDVISRASTIFLRQDLVDATRALAPTADMIVFDHPFAATVDAIIAHPGDCVVIASGDPNFFGITRTLRRAKPDVSLRVLPGPTSLAILAARIGRPWDDVTVISLVGRDPYRATARALKGLTESPTTLALLVPPQTRIAQIAQHLIERDECVRITIGTDLATEDEVVSSPATSELLTWESPSPAVVLIEVGTPDYHPPLSSKPAGISVFRDEFSSDGTNFTKLDIRMAVIARLEPDRLRWGAQVIEVGAGSGMLGLTLLRIRPDLILTQLEPNRHRAAITRENAEALGYQTTVCEQQVQSVQGSFDAAIVGGGGIGALRHTLELIDPEAPIVATYADLHRAAEAERLLGNVSLIQVAHGAPLGDDGTRMIPQSPIYVTWR